MPITEGSIIRTRRQVIRKGFSGRIIILLKSRKNGIEKLMAVLHIRLVNIGKSEDYDVW